MFKAEAINSISLRGPDVGKTGFVYSVVFQLLSPRFPQDLGFPVSIGCVPQLYGSLDTILFLCQTFTRLIMAPIKDETVEALRDLVNKLETRVEQLEAKLQQTDGNHPTRKPRSTESIRMILMGPPGAGIYILLSFLWQVTLMPII